MKVIKIKKMSNNKYKILLDDDIIITFDNVILKYNLLYKKDLNEKELKEIISDTTYYDVYNKTLSYATKKIRSEREIKKYLHKFNIKEKEKNKIVKKLKDLNFIDDKNYCQAFINDKIHLSKYGIKRIKQELLRENIDDNIIEDEMSKIDTNQVKLNLENKIKEKIENNHKFANNALKNKLLLYFINEGYDKNDILYYLNKYEKNDSNILEQEFNKLYFKCKDKYDDNVFISKIKQKLSQKGFSYEDINKLIQEKTEE